MTKTDAATNSKSMARAQRARAWLGIEVNGPLRTNRSSARRATRAKTLLPPFHNRTSPTAQLLTLAPDEEEQPRPRPWQLPVVVRGERLELGERDACCTKRGLGGPRYARADARRCVHTFAEP